VKKGRVFSLGLKFDGNGPQIGQGGRVNPQHFMTATAGVVYPHSPFRFSDDVVVMPLQCATQWDSLAHVHYDGKLYNGYPADTITAAGAAKNSIDKQADGIVSRGVLLDLARAAGVERLQAGHAIQVAELEAAETKQGVRVETGDVLLVRTGHLAAFKNDGDRVAYMRMMPGLSLACAEWLHAREVAAVATDTNAVEVIPFEDNAVPLPLHMVCIRDMGLTLGEMFDLDAIAEDCAADGVYDFFFSAPPLKVTGGVGSPLNPLAIK
jgi:kynurenine formamidase